MNVETDIVTSMAVSPILVIMYAKTFKTDIIVSICNIIMFLMSHWLIISSIGDSYSILELSLAEIKGKISNLLINEFIVAR